MMVSSQVEIVASSQFGCILKEHGRKERRKDTNSNLNQNSQDSLQRNLKEFVRDHIHSCVGISSRSSNLMPNIGFRYQGNDVDYLEKHNCIHEKKEDGETSVPICIRESRGLDQWASQQAKDMINTIQSQGDELEFVGLSMSESISPRTSSLIRYPSPTPSDNSSTDVSVSSLVQKWRGFEAGSICNQTNNNKLNIKGQNLTLDEKLEDMGSYNSKSTITSTEDTLHVKDSTMYEDQFQQLQEEQLQLDANSFHVDGHEEERIRVADIVRKWATSNQETNYDVDIGTKSSVLSSLGRLKSGMDIRDQHVPLSPVIFSPKLRGRHAITYFFKTMEKDRYKEIETLNSRQVVTKFPQRGRIQSLLRLKFLRREAHEQNGNQVQSLTRKSGTIKLDTTLVTNDSRERYVAESKQKFNTIRKSLQQVMNINLDEETSRNDKETCKQKVFIKDSSQVRNEDNRCCTAVDNVSYNHTNIDIFSRENPDYNKTIRRIAKCIEEQHKDLLQSDEDNTKEILFYHTNESTNQNSTSISAQTIQVVVPSSNVLQQDREIEKDKNSYIEERWGNIAMYNEEEKQEEKQEQEDDDDDDDDVEGQEQNEIIVEQQDKSQYPFESNLDWTIDIARPRSYWQDRRQSWYEEILSTKSKDEEIRQLLERGSVSSVLTSDFREQMDKLLLSNVKRAFYSTTIEREEKGFELEELNNDQPTTMDIVEHNQYHEDIQEFPSRHEFGVPVEQHQLVVNDQGNHIIENNSERKKLTTSVQEYHETSDGYDPTSSSPQLPGIHYPDHETSDDSDHVPLMTLRKHLAYHPYHNNIRKRSSLKHMSSMDMEVIFDLRANIQELHSEMFELRKSINTCIDMQMKLQKSIR